MELRHLVTFETIVEKGGFKKAADELGYAQSSITAHIKALEEELGYPLFDRMGKTITLTETGRRFLPYAAEIIKLYAKSKQTIQEDDHPAGFLSIGASESLMIYWLPEKIRQFMEFYPKVELTLKSIDYENLSGQLKKGDIDAAILVDTPDWQPKDLTIEKIKEDRLTLVEAARPSASRIAETMLVTEYTCSWRPLIEEYLRKEAAYAKIELPSIEAIKQCVLSGLGKAMLPSFTVNNEVKNGELAAIPISTRNEIGIYTAFHKDKWRSRNLQAFLSLLSD
ncbi:LysR family transcriptional regulator [Sediminibacillus halophilus]|uniref:DNA-binding transcriptional regulator, LysR family n=1 Tax=Sediminibacillus halophilus TaxID=482461 RepID=A0A1G9P1Y4_9BACI|nr:LysR family transcriptional regulator [Sediminibacillus halophilus]SDL92621.1 DNA-binding transcriptional regulator, LysR family [Sediminibacillus halophilus]